MKNWKSKFKIKFRKGSPLCINEKRPEVGISSGEIGMNQFDSNTKSGADKKRDAVYARCGEVYSAP